MKDPGGIEERLLGLPRPEPSVALRGRVLEEAGRVAIARLTATDRLWFSPGLRLSWAVMVILVMALEIAANASGPGRPATGTDVRQAEARGRLVALAIEAGLDPETSAAIAARSIAETDGEDPGKEIDLRARRFLEVEG